VLFKAGPALLVQVLMLGVLRRRQPTNQLSPQPQPLRPPMAPPYPTTCSVAARVPKAVVAGWVVGQLGANAGMRLGAVCTACPTTCAPGTTTAAPLDQGSGGGAANQGAAVLLVGRSASQSSRRHLHSLQVSSPPPVGHRRSGRQRAIRWHHDIVCGCGAHCVRLLRDH
jgi:hypothetical protein